MAAPVLLVADDLSLIAAVKRVLAREGYECVLATSAADAIIAFGHSLPGLMLLQPSVESGRGNVVLEELRGHPDAQLLKVLLLGETIRGFACPVEPLPVDAEHLSTSISDNFRAHDSASSWEVREASTRPATPSPPAARELEPWRATRLEAASVPVVEPDAAAPPAYRSGPSFATLERNLFGDLPSLEDELHRDIEAEARASVESTLAQDEELRRLEEEVRAEAHRRRETNEPGVVVAPPVVAPATARLDDPEQSFSQLEPAEAAAEAPREPRATQTLARAEQMLLEARAVAEAQRRADEAETRRADAELEAIGRRAEHAESLVRRERELRASLEVELETLRAHRDDLDGQRAQLIEQLSAAQQAQDALAGQLAESAGAVQARDAQLAELARRRDDRITELTRAREERLAELNRQQAEAISALTRRHDEQLDQERVAHAHTQARLERVHHELGEAQDQRAADDETSAAVEDLQSRLAEASATLELAQGDLAEANLTVEHLQARLAEASANGELLEHERVAHDTTRAALEIAQADASSGARAAMDLERVHAAHAQVRDELATALTALERSQLAAANGELAEATLAAELGAQREAREQAARDGQQWRARCEELEAQTASQTADLATRADALDEERAAHGATRRALELAVAEVTVLASESAQLEGERTAHDATRHRLAEVDAQLEAVKAEGALLEEARTEAELGRQAADEVRARLDTEVAALQQRVADLEPRLASATEFIEEAALQRQRVEGELTSSSTLLAEALTAAVHRETEKAALADELERATARNASTLRELATVKDSLEALRTRAEQAEAHAALASEKMRELEHRETMPLSLPGRKPPGVARHGSVDLEGLARLFSELVFSAADVRVELGAAGGTRTLWLKKGHIIAASSTFDSESIIDRARRDGLIDGRQEAELRMLRTATLREQLDALKLRGFIRDAEAVPLVQRCAENLALEALAEESTQYRLTEEHPGADVTPVTMPRATLPILAEALRRAVPADALLERLGGGEAVPQPVASGEWDLRSLGFSDRERKMLSWVDGEATVEDVTLASGLKPESAFRALLVAKLMGVLEIKVPEARAPVIDAELEVRRLEAKFDEVHDADYFAVLGLERTAGADDVRRAWQRLSAEFHPLRFSGHPDPGLQQRAQVVYSLLEEAARALEDDRRRAEYARHLLD